LVIGASEVLHRE